MLRNYDYCCPHCKASLFNLMGVSFYIKNEYGQGANLHLSPNPGTYHYMSDADFSFGIGEKLDFHCISCKKNLQSVDNPKFVEIHLKVSEEILFEVLFSPICGEKLTYIVMEGKLEKYERNILAFDYLRKEAS